MKTIQVKEIYRNPGKTKAGKPYTLTKLLGDDSKYYTTFNVSSILSSIKKGAIVRLEFEEGNKDGYYNITKIIDVDANPTYTTEMAGKAVGPNVLKSVNPQPSNDACSKESVSPPMAGALPYSKEASAQIEERVRLRLRKAKALIQKECPEAIDTHDYAALLAECMHEYFAEEMAIRIQASKEQRPRW